MDNRSKVVSNLIWRFFERFGAQTVNIVVGIVLARKLGPGPAGDIAVILAVITILRVFADSGMGNALIQKKDPDDTDFSALSPEEYPTLSAFYAFLEQQYSACGETALRIYTRPTLQQVLLGLHAMCKGADAKFFDGCTNIGSSRLLVFGVKGLDGVSENVRRTILLNLLSYMTDQLLIEGNTVAVLDELYKWLGNPVAVEYIRNAMKRVRKKDSAMVLASQNLEDFDQPGIREMTKPLFAIPPHQFLFNPGTIPAASFMDMLQLESSEFQLIREPHRGVCLYKCGSERYLLEVHAPPYKQALFGKEGGR